MKDYEVQCEWWFSRLDRSLGSIDPDLAECLLSQGTCTIIFKDAAKLILSKQKPVHQLWLVWTKEAIALHYNYDMQDKAWISDKPPYEGLDVFIKKIFHSYGLTLL